MQKKENEFPKRNHKSINVKLSNKNIDWGLTKEEVSIFSAILSLIYRKSQKDSTSIQLKALNVIIFGIAQINVSSYEEFPLEFPIYFYQHFRIYDCHINKSKNE